jgi:formyltetrahydrofolate hydrolase
VRALRACAELRAQAAKAAQEAALESLLAEHGIDLIVMARYMQVSSAACGVRMLDG